MLLSPAAMCSCLEAFPNQRDHPNSPSELPYQFQSTCSSSPPALSSRSACREHSRCVNTAPALLTPQGRSPVYNHPLPATQSSPAWSEVAPYPSSSACSHGQSCPSYNPVPCVCPARGCAVLPQHLIPSSLSSSSATRDSPARPTPGIARSSHHLQALGEKVIKYRTCLLRPQLQGGGRGAGGKVWRNS